MYIQRRFPFKRLVNWTKRELIFFIIIATITTVLYELLDLKWLQILLTPVGLIGTAVAFMIGFQNNAAYDRIWEARVMTKDNKPNALSSLQSKHLRQLTDDKKLWNFTFLNLQQILNDLTEHQGKTERIKNFPYPKQYGSVGYHFAHIFIYLLPLAIIPTFAKMGLTVVETNPILSNYFVWFNILCTVAVIWVFNTMLRIGLAGENPFEDSINDVPISNVSREITRDILQIIDEVKQISQLNLKASTIFSCNSVIRNHKTNKPPLCWGYLL